MSEKAESSREPEAGKLARALRWTAMTVGGLLGAVILIVAVVIVFGIPIELRWVKGKIETAASDALERPVSIDGPLVLVPSVPPAAQIEGVRLGNPEGWPEEDLARLDLARAELRVLPLLRGEILIEEITVDGLHVNLQTNARGETNWLLEKPDATPEPEPEREAEPRALRFIELAELALRDIVLRHRDERTGKTFELELKEIRGSAEDREPMRLTIEGAVQDVPYEVAFNGGSLAALVASEAPWPLELSATAVGAELKVSGSIAQPLRGKGLALAFDLTGPVMKDLEAILDTRLPPIQSFALQGRIEEAGGKYRIADLSGEIAATGVTGSFEADTSGEKPRLTGDVDILHIDAGPLFAAIGEEEKSKGGSAGPSAENAVPPDGEENAGTGEKVDLDEPVLTLDVFEKFDARFGLTIHEVVNAPTGLRDAHLKVTVEDGKLSAPLGVALADVPFTGELSLAPEEGQPMVAVTLAAEQSDIGELATLLTGATGIEGSFDHARLELSAQGESVRSLVETAELRFSTSGATLSYGHDTGGRSVEFGLDEAELIFPAADESRISARGSLLGEAFSLELEGGTFIENFVEKSWPLKLTASGGGAMLEISGTARRAEEAAGSKFDFSFTGERIGGLSAWLGVSPEAGQGYVLTGTAAQTLAGVGVRIDEARIGNSGFSGEVGIRKEGATAVTFADLDFELLDLKGFAGLFPEKEESDEPPAGGKEAGPGALTIDVPILPRGIEIFDSDIDVAIARIKLELADITDVSVSSQIREGYVEKAPISAVIVGSRFEGSFGIDLRGEIPRIGLEIQSSKVEVGTLLAQLGVVDGLNASAGGFDLDLELEGASTREILERSSLSVGIRDGAWSLRSPGAETGLTIRVPDAAIGAEPGEPTRLTIDGLIDRTPVRIEVSTDPLGTFAEPKEKLEMDVGVALAKADLKLTGAAPLPVRGDNLHFAMDLRGRRFSDFDELLNVDLPPVGPYRLQGGFGSQQSGYYVRDLRLTVGESNLTGRLDLKTAQRPPFLGVDLVARRIQLDDFDTGDWSATGEGGTSADEEGKTAAGQEDGTAAAGGRSLLSPEVMRSLDSKLTIGVDEVLSGRDHLGRGTLIASLQNGRFAVDPLVLDLPGGAVDVSFALEPGERDVSLDMSAKVDKLDYGILARRIDPKSQTGGLISVDLDLNTRGPDLKRVMSGANGHLDFGLWPEDLNAGIFELWAVNVIAALMSEVDKDDASKVNCVIVRFQVDNGLMQERVVYADTTKMHVEGSATVNFRARTLDVYARPKAKRPEFFSLAVPVGLSGPFDDFGLDINPVVLTGKAISFVTSPLHVPVRRIFKRGEPADGRQACAEAWAVRDPGQWEGEPSRPAPEAAPVPRTPAKPKYKEQAPSILDEIE